MGSALRRTFVLLFVLSPLAAPAAAAEPTAASAAPLEQRLALAATAAAESTLRLHETGAAKRWLAQVPGPLRAWEWRHLAARADESVATIAAHEGRILGISVSADGRRLATAGADKTARLWDSATGKLLATLSGHGAAVWNAVFSPDGARLATSSSDGTVRVWDVGTGAELRRLEGVGKGIAAVAWKPDGTELTSVSWDRTKERGVWGVVKSCDPRTGALVRSLEHGVKPITCAAYSPDGSRFAAGTWDDDVAVWDTSAWGAPVRLVPPKDDADKAVQAVAFSRDGRSLAVGT